MENARLMQGVKRGIFSAEDLQSARAMALNDLRAYDQGERQVDDTLDAVMDYHQFLCAATSTDSGAAGQGTRKDASTDRSARSRTQPWKACGCDICRAIGVEVIIFRSSNRNKRRGFHNLGVYHRHLHKTLEKQRDHLSIQGRSGAAGARARRVRVRGAAGRCA